MKRPSFHILTVVAALFLFLQGCREEPEEVAEERPVYITTYTAQRQSIDQELEVTGNIRPWEQAFITGQTGVQIQDINADVGDQVNQGQVVVRMQQPQLGQAEAQLQQARRDVERMRNLFEVGSVSRQQYEQAQVQLEQARSSYEQLIQNTTLTSPISGIVSEKYFVQGEVYTPSADASAILVIVDINPVKMVVNISNQYYTDINRGDNAMIRLDNFPGQAFQGTVNKKAPTIAEATRTFEVEIRINNDRTILRPGMYATALFNLGEETGLYIPATAVLKQPGTEERYVYIINEGIAERKFIETGVQAEDMVQVLQGIEAGQMVAVDGAAKLEEGSPVIIKNSEE